MSNRIYVADGETQDKIYNILAPEKIYGFIEHNAILSPGSRIEYVGANKNFTPLSVDLTTGATNYGSWGDFPFLKANKPYMVHSDAAPDYRLNENDYTLREDGAASDVSNTAYDGGAFAWIPKIYKKEFMAGDDRYVYFSMTKREGFEPVGFIDSNNAELEGVWLPMFYGSIVSDKMKSIAGTQPEYNHSTTDQKAAIDKAGTRARFLGGPIMSTLTDIEIMLTKTTEIQGALGLGNCFGYDASQPPTYGVKPNNIVGGGQFYGRDDGRTLGKVFHSIAFGSYQIWLRDPYTVMVNGRIKVSKNYSYDITGAAYSDTGITLPEQRDTSGNQVHGVFYPHKYRTVPGFGALPVYPYKGSTAEGGCDGLWQNCEITAVSIRLGCCNSGRLCGPRCLSLDNAAGDANWYIGSALLLLPPAGVAA